VGRFGRAEDAELPPQYPQAVELAERLSRGTDYIRCDLYPLNGRVYFSELTVYPLAGYSIYRSDEVMKNMSALWDLRQSWFLRNAQPGMRGVYARSLRKALEKQNRAGSRGQSA
jgi:hypothetical protein